ncbi:APC family permease, partial [archaeon]
WAPLIWLGTMAIIVPVQVHGKKMFWVATFLLALAVVTVFIMYLLEAGSAKGISNFHVKNFEKSPHDFFVHLPLAVAFYAGIDAVRTCTDTQSNHTVPKDMVICMCSAGVLALCLILTASCLTDNGVVLSGASFPLSEGFAKVMDISQRDADWLSLPGALAGSFAFTYAFGRQLRSMAGSGLLPAFLSTAHTEQKVGAEESQRAAQESDAATKDQHIRRGSFMGSLKGSLKKVDAAIKHHVPKKPVAALLFGSLVSYCLLLLGHYVIPQFEIRFLRLCVLLAAAVYSSLLAAYFVFMLRYSNLDRTFRSPFGLSGACVSLFVFLIIIACVSFMQPGEHSYTLAVFAGLCAVYYVYYVCVARKHQFFSKEEQEKFMKAYVVNANANRKKNKK